LYNSSDEEDDDDDEEDEEEIDSDFNSNNSASDENLNSDSDNNKQTKKKNSNSSEENNSKSEMIKSLFVSINNQFYLKPTTSFIFIYLKSSKKYDLNNNNSLSKKKSSDYDQSGTPNLINVRKVDSLKRLNMNKVDVLLDNTNISKDTGQVQFHVNLRLISELKKHKLKNQQ